MYVMVKSTYPRCVLAGFLEQAYRYLRELQFAYKPINRSIVHAYYIRNPAVSDQPLSVAGGWFIYVEYNCAHHILPGLILEHI